MKMPRANRISPLKAFLSAVVIIGGSLGGYAWLLQLTGNFHEVIPGQLYRSAQPSPTQLARYVKANGIRTVINLRGSDENARWYKEEITAASSLGLQHIDFRMSASQQLSPQKADELVKILRAAPKPILVHCSAGADRSGLVSVIYSEQIAGVRDIDAEKQLSFYYGHVGLPILSSAYAMDQSWNKLEVHFDVNEQASTATTKQNGG